MFEKTASSLGTLAGLFYNGFEKARQPSRPQFLSAAALQEEWKMGTYWRSDELQQRALRNSWVFSAAVMIAGEVASAKLRIIKRTEEDLEVEVKNHPFEKLLDQPNPFISRSFLWWFTTLWLKLEGNAYWFLIPASSWDKRILEIWPLPSSQVTPHPGDAKKWVDYYVYTPLGREYHIPPEQMLHLYNYPDPFNVFLGLSELMAAMLPSDSDSAMSRWNGSFFGRDNTMPSAIINLSSGNPRVRVADADLLAIKKDLQDEYAASNRKTLVTSAQDIQVEQLGWSARDMDFTAGRAFSRREIFEIFGIPEGITSESATEANARIADRRFRDTVWTRTLSPTAEQITSGIIKPWYGQEYSASFGDIRPGVRELELLEIDRAKGALTINEVRQRYWRLPPLEKKELGEKVFTGNAPFEAGQGPLLGGQLPGRNGQNADKVEVNTRPSNSPIQRDVRRMKQKALKAFREKGSADIKFVSVEIDEEDLQELLEMLASCSSEDEIREVCDAFSNS